MPELQGPEPQQRARQIQSMFDRITPRYDRMNRLISAGMDAGWRKAAARAARPTDCRVLDLGCGTGDLSRELVAAGAAEVVGADFSLPMLQVASERYASAPEHSWVGADGLRLPFRDSTFDRTTNAFLLRNLVDLEGGLREMARILKPGGRVICLDMTHPPPGPFAALYRVYFNKVMPPVAGRLSGNPAAYRYLPNSLTNFPTADELSALLERAGFAGAGYQRLGGGSVAMHGAVKPA